MRKLALLAALVVASMAMTATTASAATVVKDSAGQLCPAVSPAIDQSNPFVYLFNPPTYQSGGCTVHMQASGATTMGAQLCNINYDLHVGPDGWGYANNFQFNNCGTGWSTVNRVVMPKGVNPYGLFTAANASTDFNSYWVVNRYPSTYDAYVSLDVTTANPFRVVNQRAGSSFGGGSWLGNTSLQITH